MSEIKQAHGMAISVCEDDHLHVEFMNENGEVFATAAANLEDVGEQLILIVDEYLDLIGEDDDDDVVGPVAGSC